MKRLSFFLFFVCLTFVSHAQFKANRLTLGGGVGLQFGDYTVVSVSPQVGYDISRYLNTGVGFSYSYFSQKYTYVDQYKQTNHYLGFNAYAKLYPLPFIVLMVQPEANRMWQTVTTRSTGDQVKTEKFVPAFLVGGGVRLGPVTAMIQYDLVQDNYSPYSDKIFYSIGYTFSF